MRMSTALPHVLHIVHVINMLDIVCEKVINFDISYRGLRALIKLYNYISPANTKLRHYDVNMRYDKTLSLTPITFRGGQVTQY